MRVDIKQLLYPKEIGIGIKTFCEIGARESKDCINIRDEYNLNPEDCYIFEANPYSYKDIKKDLNNHNVYHYAVTSDYVDKINFNCFPVGKRGISSVLERTIDEGFDIEVKTVPAIRMDTFLKNNNLKGFDLIKIDVEGYGYEVLMSFGDFLNNNKFIQIEAEVLPFWKNQKLYPEIITLMEGFGFELIFLEGSSAQKELFFKNCKV